MTTTTESKPGTLDLTQRRSRHPFLMYDAIVAQPAALADVLLRNRDSVAALARALAGVSSLTLTGIGTSLNAAMLGEYWLRTVAGWESVRALNAMELSLYAPPLRPGAALLTVSHRGWKQFSARAVSDARGRGLLTAAVSGLGAREGAREADYVFLTTEQEQSGAHTKSFTTALAILFSLALELRRLASGEDDTWMRLSAAFERVPELYRRRIAADQREREAAERFRNYRRIIFLGAGPNYVSAREAALKMKEATFTYAEALQLEEFLHGPTAAVDDQTLVVLIAPLGAATERAIAAAQALSEIGAARLALVSPAEAQLSAHVDLAIPVEAGDEVVSPFAMVLSLQLFTYYSALQRGCDPDMNHREDPRFLRAASHYQL